ncbi:kinesin-like protein KIN-14N isoform X3 [Setaria italica]|nr:kinesin-like protein KIN-14N isoform X3 [Setaria italica]
MFDSSMKQVEDMRKVLQSSLKAASDAESRAAIAEAKCSDLEAKLKSRKVTFRDTGRDIPATSEENDELFQLKEQLEKYKEEAQANRNYMVQYKEIADSNEVALKQLESAHQDYKAEAEVGREALEDEIAKLRDKLSYMEKSYLIKCEEAASAIESKEKQITSLVNEISVLRTDVSQRLPQVEKLEMELASSKSALDEQYKRWRSAEENYERQRDWAELKELQEQGDLVRVLDLDQKNMFDSCMKQVEDMRKGLQSSLKAASDAESRAAIAEIDDEYTHGELEEILSQWVDNPNCELPSDIQKINIYDEDIEELKKYAKNGIAYFVLKLTPAKGRGGGFTRKMKNGSGSWVRANKINGNKCTIRIYKFNENSTYHRERRMMEFTLNNGPQDMVLCSVEWDCKTSKIKNDATKVRITRRCQEVETSQTEEVECFKQKLLEAEKKIQFFERKLEEADRTCLEQSNLEQKLEEAEKACLELRRHVTYIEDEKKSLKQNVIEIERLLLESEDLRKDLHNQMMALKGNMRVFCRVRPLAAKDNPNDQKLIIFPESLEYSGRGLQVVHNGHVVSHTYDRVFKDTCSQEVIFNEISELVRSALDGYKVTIFSYGQTGSGKTYTMIGKPDDKGMIPRALTEIFNKIGASIQWNFDVEASMFEIYNEKIYDLLDTSMKKNCDVRTDEHGRVMVSGLVQQPVRDEDDAAYLFKEALKHRSVGKTQMNENSSRSHFVFKLIISGYNKQSNHKIEGVLQMIDLAGSESVSKTTDVLDATRNETGNINKSLLALGQVFEAIPKGEFLPFRGSKLTHFLQNSFEGHSKVLLFVNISQDPMFVHATLGSLKFADKVRKCMVNSRVRAVQEKSMLHEDNEGHSVLPSTHKISKSLFKQKATEPKGQGAGKFGTSVKHPKHPISRFPT